MTSGTQAEKSKRVATSAAISAVREPFMSRAKAWVSVADSRCSRVYHSAKVRRTASGRCAAGCPGPPWCGLAKNLRPGRTPPPDRRPRYARSPRRLGPVRRVRAPHPAGRWLLDQMASQGDQQLLFAVGVQAVQPWNQCGPRRRGTDLKADLGQYRARLSGLAEQRQQQPRPQ